MAHPEERQSPPRQKQKQKHFLVATFPFQGHINPALNLAKRLALAAAPSASVTFSTTAAAHRRMFPSAASDSDDHDDGLLTYAPFSDGHDDGRDGAMSEFNRYMSDFERHGSRHLSDLLGNFAARGRPVSCVIYTILLPWAADVARRHGIPSTLYWIQPASVLAVYYHYFHGYDGVISAHRHEPSFAVNLPGLPPQDIRDLPSFLVDGTSVDEASAFYSVYRAFLDLFAGLDREKEATPTVLVNTFEDLEPRELASISEHLRAVPIGPVLKPSLFGLSGGRVDERVGGDLFELDDERRYVEWLDAKAEGSVVYAAFGSLSSPTEAQLEELLQGLEGCGRPYVWVVRRENRGSLGAGGQGLVVGWCDQGKVLSHRAVGCFVTHCGWNSVLESVACGVPMVAAPRMSDQAANARLAAAAWGTAVRARLGAEGVLERDELQRCVEAVLGEGEAAAEVRRRAQMCREKARQALGSGGSSDRNLKAYVDSIRLPDN